MYSWGFSLCHRTFDLDVERVVSDLCQLFSSFETCIDIDYFQIFNGINTLQQLKMLLY